jgi:hypothetical protein
MSISFVAQKVEFLSLTSMRGLAEGEQRRAEMGMGN